jgi:hypothetical protein
VNFYSKNKKHAPSASLARIGSPVYLCFLSDSIENHYSRVKIWSRTGTFYHNCFFLYFFMPHYVKKRCITCFNNIFDIFVIKNTSTCCVWFSPQMSVAKCLRYVVFLARNIFIVKGFMSTAVEHELVGRMLAATGP